MNVAQVQLELATAGFACVADGVLGPRTYAAMASYAVPRALGQLGRTIGAAMAARLALAGVTSDLGLVHWIAQASHETGGFRWLTEQGGEAGFAPYEGRADLGNSQPGDGYRYRGRGVFQITGRWNYRHFGQVVGEPLEDQPDLAARPAVAVALACAFWAERRIQPLADADDVAGVTRKINGGLTGLAERQALTTRLKRLCGLA